MRSPTVKNLLFTVVVMVSSLMQSCVQAFIPKLMKLYNVYNVVSRREKIVWMEIILIRNHISIVKSSEDPSPGHVSAVTPIEVAEDSESHGASDSDTHNMPAAGGVAGPWANLKQLELDSEVATRKRLSDSGPISGRCNTVTPSPSPSSSLAPSRAPRPGSPEGQAGAGAPPSPVEYQVMCCTMILIDCQGSTMMIFKLYVQSYDIICMNRDDII